MLRAIGLALLVATSAAFCPGVPFARERLARPAVRTLAISMEEKEKSEISLLNVPSGEEVLHAMRTTP